ncbi:hypothetical protein ACROYT_G015845 [Oculina patagonica]
MIRKYVNSVKTLITNAQAINEHGPTDVERSVFGTIVFPTARGMSISPKLAATNKTEAVFPDTVTKYSAKLMADGKTDAIEMPKSTVPAHSFLRLALSQLKSVNCEIRMVEPNKHPAMSSHSILEGLKYFDKGTDASRANAKLPQNADVRNAALSSLICASLFTPNVKM